MTQLGLTIKQNDKETFIPLQLDEMYVKDRRKTNHQDLTVKGDLDNKHHYQLDYTGNKIILQLFGTSPMSRGMVSLHTCVMQLEKKAREDAKIILKFTTSNDKIIAWPAHEIILAIGEKCGLSLTVSTDYSAS